MKPTYKEYISENLAYVFKPDFSFSLSWIVMYSMSLIHHLIIFTQGSSDGDSVEHSCLLRSQELAMDVSVLQDQTSAEERSYREGAGYTEGGVPEAKGGS